jgi:hypothetical protein
VARAWLGLAALLAACEVEPGHAPVARIAATPLAVLENDNFQTEVVLDGSASADPIDDPDATLDYRWEIGNDEVRVVDGALTSSRVTVTFFGARPPTVRLTVTDDDGRTSTARLQLQLTLR